MKRLVAILLTVVLLTVSWSFEAAAAEVKKEMRAFSLDLFSYLSDNACCQSGRSSEDRCGKRIFRDFRKSGLLRRQRVRFADSSECGKSRDEVRRL